MRQLRWGIGTIATLMALTALQASPVAAQHGHQNLPDSIALPNGWQPEGITTDGKFVYSGSLADGSIFRANVRTGVGKVLADRCHRTGGCRARLRQAPRPVVGRRRADRRDPGPGRRQRQGRRDLRVPLDHGRRSVPQRRGRDPRCRVRHRLLQPGARGDPAEARPRPRQEPGPRPPPRAAAASAATTLPLTGDVAFQDGFNLNGIVESRHMLISVQSNTGLLFRINERTGVSRTINLHGDLVTAGDGLELDGRLLYVGRNVGEVDAVKLSHSLTAATWWPPSPTRRSTPRPRSPWRGTRCS